MTVAKAQSMPARSIVERQAPDLLSTLVSQNRSYDEVLATLQLCAPPIAG